MAPVGSPIDRSQHRDVLLVVAGLALALAILLVGFHLLRGVAWLWAWSPVFVMSAALFAGVGGQLALGARTQRRRVLAFEREQRAKGLVPCPDDQGDVRWVHPGQVEAWAQEAREAQERERLEYRVVEAVRAFEPSMRHAFELPYHMELTGYLRAHFPEARPEMQRGASRPDIVVRDVAVEVKGPTRVEDLVTLADKCMRYEQHFESLVVVLFDVQVHERRFLEWARGMRRTFPRTVIFRKESPSSPTSVRSGSRDRAPWEEGR